MATKKKGNVVSRATSAVRKAVSGGTTKTAAKSGGSKKSASKRGTSSKKAATTPAAAGAAASGDIETAADVQPVPNKPHRGTFKAGDSARHNDENIVVRAVNDEAQTADIEYTDRKGADDQPVWVPGVAITELS